jgi:MFS family permease
MDDTRLTGPYAALHYPDFRLYITANFFITAALLIQESVLSYELYLMTKDPLSLGLIGLAEAIPYISLALFGGHYADRRNKQHIMRNSLLLILLGSTILSLVTLSDVRSTLPEAALLVIIYAVIVLLGIARGFFGPASSSLKPFLVPRSLYANSSTWSSTAWQSGAVVGPAVSGILYDSLGLTHTFNLVMGIMLLVILLVSQIKTHSIAEGIEDKEPVPLWDSLKEGIRYVLKTKMIFYAISLDLFSVLFGGVIALLPVYAQDILQVGSGGFGILKAAPAIGAMSTMLAMAYIPPTRHAWRNLLIAIGGFGIATLVFAVSKNMYVSVIALFLTGAFDSISVVIRQTILQVMTPEKIRGRVYAVNGIFVSSSNELGAFEPGVAASLLGTVPSVVFGAGMTLLIVLLVSLNSKELLKAKIN